MCSVCFCQVHSVRSIKKEFLFCSELDTTTTSADVVKMRTIFLKHLDCNGKMFVMFVPMELP